MGADNPKEDALKKDLAKFQGTWKLVSVEVDGEKRPDEGFSNYTAVITGDQWTISEGGKITSKVAFILDPTKKPKTIDLVDLKTKNRIRGIYSFADDTLTIYGRAPEVGDRPTGFGTQRDSGAVQFIYQRVKPSEQSDGFANELAKPLRPLKAVSMEHSAKRAEEAPHVKEDHR
jgi:uncharacterized protein (TIGR03067 family)